MIIEVTPVNERIIRLRIRHSLCVISLVSVNAPFEVIDLNGKEAFHSTLESVVDQCARRDTLLFSWGISLHRLALTGMWNCEPE